jgi:hypothetical protein
MSAVDVEAGTVYADVVPAGADGGMPVEGVGAAAAEGRQGAEAPVLTVEDLTLASAGAAAALQLSMDRRY